MPGSVETPNDRRGAERRARDLETLARVSRSLLRSIDLDEQLRLTLHLAAEALGADRGSIMLIDPREGDLEIRVSEGLPSGASRRLRMGEGISGWVAQHNEPVVLHGGVDDPRFAGRDPSIGSALSLPLAIDAGIIGVLNIVRRSGERFTEQDLNLATALADLASLALEKAQLYGKLRDRETRISSLFEAAIGAQEQERRRIAAEIHDGFLQDLSALFLKAEMAKVMIGRGRLDEAAEHIAEIQEDLRNEVGSVREFIFEVRPPSLDEVGLGPTLQAMIDRAAQDAGLDSGFADRLGKGRLPEVLETVLYRTAQEALRNVVKHAGARRVEVTLERSGGHARLVVRDDGRGVGDDLDALVKPGHFGIETMRERIELAGGSLSIASDPSGGTRVEALVPAP